MQNKKSRIIGVDVGGTKILLQTFDEKMNLIEEEKVFTEVKKGQAGFTKQLISLLEKYFHPKIKSIGVALPGIVDQKKGILVRAPHLPVKNLVLRRVLEVQFKKPIYLDHDINAFLFVQSQRIPIQKYKNLIAVMVGTGVGGAVMVEGKLMYGKNGFAGEVGHMVIKDQNTLKTFEQNTSGFFIPKIAKELGIKSKFGPLDLAQNSVKAKKVKAHIVDSLAIGLANLNLIFNPEAFVLGGSVYDKFLTPYKRQLQKIIAQYALDQKSPLIFDADKKHTAALGVAMMSRI